MNLTSEQIAEVYNLITNQNKEFVRAIARHALKTSAEVKADMWAQMDDPKPQPPALGDVRDMAAEFFGDMVFDFKTAVTEEIATTDVTLHYELAPQFMFGGR